MKHMESYNKLLLANKAWVKEMLGVREDFFEKMVNGQNPDFLWIGCSDSRVPAEDITGAEPGEIFVHRNVANLVVHTDLNLFSVLQYAVEVLEVEHIIVCGHYNCGGIKHAMTQNHLGLINKWLHYVKDVHKMNEVELDKIECEDARFDRMVELNVIQQVNNLQATAILQKSWLTSRKPSIHGWVYDIRSGLIKELVTLDSSSAISPIYKYSFSEDQLHHFTEEASREGKQKS